MRVSEIRLREDFDTMMCQTLSAGWTAQFNMDIAVTNTQTEAAQPWLLQSLLSALYVPTVRDDVRQFVADSFRYTPRLLRMAPQWLLGTALSTSVAMRWVAQQSIWVTPAIPDADARLVVPGNRRVRTFDFNTGTSRVFLKAGFAVDSISRELEIRSVERAGPFLPITTHDSAGTWYEEPLVHGFSLPRCPPWRSRQKYEQQARAMLEKWHFDSTSEVLTEHYVASLVQSLVDAWERVSGRYPEPPVLLPTLIEALADFATRSTVVTLTQSHGDFQPGNILIESASERVFIIDWEYTARRSLDYDFLVYDLMLRSPNGLAARITRWPGDKSALALGLLENLLHVLQDEISGQYISPSLAYTQLLSELPEATRQMAGM